MTPKRKKSIPLSAQEDHLLRFLHRQTGIPDGQFPQRVAEWHHLTAVFNEATGRNDSPEDILHYILNKRKNALWFRFDGTHQRMRCPDSSTLTVEQWEILGAIYVELGVGADKFLTDPELRKEIHARFCKAAKVHIPPLLLAAAIVAHRKGGYLPKSEGDKPNGGMGFGDIGEVA
jgi:hypothetical protein